MQHTHSLHSAIIASGRSL